MSVKDQKEKLPVYIANPESIVGCAIHHKCKEDGEIAWFDARVLRVAIFNEINPIKTEYIVHYDNEDDNTTWNFPLLSDLKNGDLIVKQD